MRPLIARLRDSERAWAGALFCGLFLVLTSGSAVDARPRAILAQASAAALGTLLAVWVARASGQRRRGLAIALAALFTTPLLPYAFVEHELTLPLLLLAAGFLAIGPTRLRAPLRGLAVVAASAGALLSAASGLLLLPMLLWLVWCEVERGGAERPARPQPRFYLSAALLVAAFAVRAGTVERQAIEWASSPVEWLVHLHGFLLSWNKGLLIFAPLVLMGLWRSFRGSVSDRHVGRFALFAAASLALPFAGLERWSDAAWGPRALLAVIAPALLALALSRTERARRGGHRRWILAAVTCGLAVNTLGTAVAQSALAEVAALAGIERPPVSSVLLQDPAWSHPRVNASLLGAWLVARLPFLPAPDPAVAPSVERLAAIARPGPVLLRVCAAGERTELLPQAVLLAILGALGWAVLVLVRHAAKPDLR